MEPLIALVAGTLGARLAGLLGVAALDGWQPALRVGLALMFLLTAFAHFYPRLRADLVEMVPPSLPRPELLVTVTGVLEAVGAIGVLIPATTRWAAAGLILLMIAMFPANVSAARRRVAHGNSLLRRTALQVLFVGAAVAVLP
ncbi:DoxX family protein [Allostreptomyces psammosilenae]|uniref:Putative membrane protein n=1 Tax=Allostreptomyces psammosilenae TaxID=1892865 RepID=A0A852ZPI7_9ACTN|nr:DoxX family membrane protein [Allostreptomyces psammosilenae]NYI04303.1 putative membrane protein [Allostreptomyces psammosilenae]